MSANESAKPTVVHSVDQEIDAAAQYALRVLQRERKHKPIKKHGVPDGARCDQGCCEMRNGYWISIE